ncbi:MAG: alpha/beta hydrolase [Comamonadaceae bacterium]|nr:MAG: alpha/beta hydrolase [Comamonadaceae bacterium]
MHFFDIPTSGCEPGHESGAGLQLETRRIAGSATLAPLVFLHEGLGSVSLWTQRGLDWPLAVCTATGRSGLVYSRAGYGASSPSPLIRPDKKSTGRPSGRLPPDYMQREAWAVLLALLENAGIRHPVLLGHSDGATIALLYASRYPVTACIAMAPHVFVEDVALQSIEAAKTAYEESLPLDNGLRARLARHHEDVDGAFWQWNDAWLSKAFRSFDIRQDCRAITSPVLAIQGRGDEYGTLAQLDEMAAAAPQTQKCVLEDCGHSPHRDQPEATLDAIARFLKTVD